MSKAPPPASPPWPTGRLFLVLLVGLGAYAALHGPIVTNDSGAYIGWADRLRASGFDYPAMIRAFGEPLGVTYALFVTLVAVLKVLMGGRWMLGLLALNAAALAGVGALLSRLAMRVSGERAAGWTALALFLLCHDILQWAPYMLSDGVFLLLAFLVFRMEAGRLLAGGGRWGPVFAASAAASLFRPTGIVLFPVTAWSWLLSVTGGTPRQRARMLAALCAASTAAAAAFCWLAMRPEAWPLGVGAKAMRDIAATYAKGLVVWDRMETYHAAPRLLADYWWIAADRLRWFFAAGAGDYSAVHWAGQIAFFGPAYALAAFFVASLLTGRSRLPKHARDVGFAAVGALLLYAFFHAMMHVDYDWRYRVPVLPHLILLAACGFAEAKRILQERLARD